MDSLVLDTVIGLVFVFATLSVATSILTEGASRIVGLRGEYLLRGIRTLVDGESHFHLGMRDMFRRHTMEPAPDGDEPSRAVVSRVLTQPIIARSAVGTSVPKNAGNTKLSRQARRSLPAYVSGRTFARALIDVVVPDDTGQTGLGTGIDAIRSALEADAAKKERGQRPLLNDDLRDQLTRFLNEAGADVGAFRSCIEQWYDDHMSRVSGWYKRKVRWISLGIAAVLVLGLNLNAVQTTRALYSDEALRGAVVTQATQAADCGKKTPAACLRDVRREIGNAESAGLPVGWGAVTACVAVPSCTTTDRLGFTSPTGGASRDLGALLLLLLGWAVMVAATVPGARFWFDALSKLGSLRSTGPKPPTS
jgi:hypothetical protein